MDFSICDNMVGFPKYSHNCGIRLSTLGSHELLSIILSCVFPSVNQMVVRGSILGTMASWSG